MSDSTFRAINPGLVARLGGQFSDLVLLTEAVTHVSYARCRTGEPFNERLEFFGDSVLKLVVSEWLFKRYPDKDEGALTKIRAWMVADKTLVTLAKHIELGSYLRFGDAEKRQGGATKPALLANAFEAVLGALYLDQGIDASTQFLVPMIEQFLVSDMDQDVLADYKTALQEALQSVGGPLPHYEVVGTMGPEHKKEFVVRVEVTWNGKPIEGTGRGTSKKAAQQAAAKEVLSVIDSTKGGTL